MSIDTSAMKTTPTRNESATMQNKVAKQEAGQITRKSRVGRYGAALLLAGVLAINGKAAQAQEVDLGTAGQYAGFFFGNASALSDVVGRLAVGGNLAIGGTSVGEGVATNSTQASLVVGGNITAFTSGSMGSSSANSFGLYAGTKASSVPGYLNLQHATSPIDFPSEYTYLSVLSQQLAVRPATGSVSQQWSTITLKGSNSDVEVFNLTAAQVKSTLTMALSNVKSSATLIFNVASDSGRQVQFGITTDVLKNRQGKVLYNLPDADVINFTGVWVWGSMLAPVACVTNSNGHIEGTMIAASWNSNMEIGNSPFQATAQ